MKIELDELEKHRLRKARWRRRDLKQGIPKGLALAKCVPPEVVRQPLDVPEIDDEARVRSDAKIGMTTLIVFRQKRPDGSVRTGLEANDKLVWDRVIPGPQKIDRAPLWYVHFRCESPVSIPRRDAVTFFVRNAIPIKTALSATANEFQSGTYGRQLRRVVTGMPDGINAEVAYFINGRTDDEGIRHAILDLTSRWDEIMADVNKAKNRTQHQESDVNDEGAKSPASSLEARGREGKRKRPPKRSGRENG